MQKLIMFAVGALAVLFLASWSYRAEGVTLGRLNVAGAVAFEIGGKSVVIGAAPVRANRVYYRLAVGER